MLQIYSYLIIARVIFSWFMTGGASNQLLLTIYRVVYGLTEPLLAPIRKLIPPFKLGRGYLDLAPFILLVLVSLVRQMLSRYLFI